MKKITLLITITITTIEDEKFIEKEKKINI